MKKLGPYIGVTGFMSLAEVVACGNTFGETILQMKNGAVTNQLKFMVGILVSSKTLAGRTNKWFNRYPVIANIPEIISSKNYAWLYTIHYNTDDSQTIDEQIDQLMQISPNIDAIQLNMKWVNHVRLQRIGRKYPNLRIILQIGTGALKEVDEPGEIFLGDALKAYEGVADDFLVDPSGGVGKELDVWRAFACIADDEIPKSMQPGIAGGFCADNVTNAKGLMRRLHRPVNLDAEGKLRTSSDETEGGGHLIVSEAQRYIIAGGNLIGNAIILANK